MTGTGNRNGNGNSNHDLVNQVCIVTGAASGMGLEIAASLAARGAHVVVLARDDRRVQEALSGVRARVNGAKIDGLACDLSSIASIKRVAQELRTRHPRIHLLVNNAAVFNKARRTTVDGLELGFAVNTLAPYLLTRLLEEQLAATGARVVNMTMTPTIPIELDDPQSQKKYHALNALKMTKAGGQYLTKELSKRYAQKNIAVLCVDPGITQSKLPSEAPLPLRLVFKLFGQKPADGARVPLAVCLDANYPSGSFVNHKGKQAPLPEFVDDASARRVTDLCATIAQA